MKPFDAYLSIGRGPVLRQIRVFWCSGVYFCNAKGARAGLFCDET